ncbi:UNVERIFIED_CONTAM: hypothetical protein PYX00_009970 [Menopon gallinae]|uniref:Cell growth-regulating nucleolar protein n=1 Tax=Menopon gallinae TaxID=328185 RepID=A0AAW2HDI3_9NEOP
MVFFTCSHCGESVKKPAVAKHYQTKCRNHTPFLTCVDCLKDFKGNEYEVHTKCVTEDERYSAKGYVPKASANKGERKQKAWSECVEGLLSTGNLRPDEKNLLQAIARFENIPRKKVKFINFLNTTARAFANRMELIDRVWEKLENYFKEANSENQQNATKSENSNEAENVSHKRKHEELNSENNEADAEGGKKKKKKNSEAEAESMENGHNGTTELEIEDKEVKKKKKKKHSENETEAMEVEGESEVAEKEGKKKKKKKQDNAGTESVENGEELNETKKKKKNSKTDGVEEMESEEPQKKKVGLDNKENVAERKGSKNCENGDSTKVPAEAQSQEQFSFNWSDVILDILSTNRDDSEMTLKKLQKKVLKKYSKASGCATNEKIVKKFTKKLNKMSGVTINGDYVSLNK